MLLDSLRVQADLNRNLTYDHALAELTPYVRDIQWNMGFSEPYQLVAPPAQMTITMDNSTGAFNIGRTDALYAGLLKTDVLIRISVGTGADRTFLCTLKTVGVQLSASSIGGPVAVLSCADWHADMMNTLYDPPLVPVEWWDLGYFRTDRMIGDAFQLRGALPMYPSTNVWWVMGASEIGVNTVTANYESGTGYLYVAVWGVYGEVRVLYYGNNTDANGQGVSLLSFIEDTCAAEMDGRFHYTTGTTDGRPIYHYMPRYELATRFNTASAKTVYTETAADAQYVIGAGQCNQMEITLYPRAIGTAGSELARSGNAFRLRAGETRELTLRYRNPDNPNESCAATAMILPVASTDYTANAEDDGSGADLTAQLNVYAENKTNAARCVLVNSGSSDLYVTLLKIRGTPLTSGSPITVNSVDAPSMKDYGVFRQVRTIAGIDDVELVQRYADWWVRRFSTPRTEFRSLTFVMDDHTPDELVYFALNAHALNTVPLQVVDRWVAQYTAPHAYWAAGVTHTISGRVWTVTLLLEDISSAVGIWKMGDSALSIIGQTARLGF
jgi:hypothetical protein